MSSILYDLSESRKGTRLPDDVISIGRPVNALERVTGADILVTVDKFKVDDLSPLVGLNGEIFDDRYPGEIAKAHSLPLPTVLLGKSFKAAVDSGLLTQRKTGTDLTSSVKKLPHILIRMQKWSNRPMLLSIGNRYTKKGKVWIDGTETNCTFAQLEGAITSWTLSGGYFREVTYDREIKGFLSHWLNWLQKLEQQPEKELPPRQAQRPVVENAIVKEKPWVVTLMSVPGWGAVKACRVAELCDTLTGVLEWATDPRWIYDYEAVERPKGVTQNDVLNLREWFGLQNVYEQIVTIAVPPGKRFSGIFFEDEVSNEDEVN